LAIKGGIIPLRGCVDTKPSRRGDFYLMRGSVFFKKLLKEEKMRIFAAEIIALFVLKMVNIVSTLDNCLFTVNWLKNPQCQ